MNIGESSKLNTTPEDTPETILRLFVYGTLKRGYWNHQRFCAQARNIEPAVVWGRLYHLHAGFPALEVPEGLILARGTSEPTVDAGQCARERPIEAEVLGAVDDAVRRLGVRRGRTGDTGGDREERGREDRPSST